MSNPRLSICIPTYNFGKFIGATLDSIIEQAGDDVEIVVGDGASTDDTAEVVKRYQNDFPNLTYCNFGKKGGVDHDIIKTVELAQGDYCWLMSADDTIKPGALNRVMQEIELGLDTYLCNRTECDFDLTPLYEKYWLDKRIDDRTFNFSDRREMFEYFKAARSLGALFSYISSIVFLRQRWSEVEIDDKLEGTNYQHVSTLFTILKRGGKHKYIGQSLVFCRGQNDSFHQKGDYGIVTRFLIDIDGYHWLGERLFSDQKLRKAFMNVMQHERHWFMWVRVAVRVQDDAMWKNIELKLLDFGYRTAQLGLINILRKIERYVPVFGALRYLRLKMRTAGK